MIVENDPLTKFSLMKTLKELFVLIAGICLLAACTKTEEKAVAPLSRYLTIDLTSPANIALNEPGGSVVFSEAGIIVGRTSSDISEIAFIAANCTCPCCGETISLGSEEAWCCNGCKSKYTSCGCPNWGPSTNPLKIYPVSQSGKTLIVVY
jgi:hypothetical protein